MSGLHLGLSDTTLNVGLLSGAEAGHEDRLGAAACGGTCGSRRRIEDPEDHRDDLSLHLSDAREDIRVNGVGDGKLSKGLRLQLDQVVAAVVHGTGHESVFPPGMVHRSQRLQLLLHRFVGPALLWEGQMSRYAGPGLYKFRLQFCDRLIDLFLHLCAHARCPQEEPVQRPADRNIAIDSRTSKSSTLELQVRFLSPPPQEEEENNIAQPKPKRQFRGRSCERVITEQLTGRYSARAAGYPSRRSSRQ